MKDLKNLIRLHKWRLDERKSQLRALEHQIESLKQRVSYNDENHRIQQDLKTKTILNEVHFDGAIYGQYIISYEEKKLNLNKELDDLQEQMLTLIDEITLIFQELKKYEITQEKNDLEERDRMNKILQQELDDIGIAQHRKRLN